MSIDQDESYLNSPSQYEKTYGRLADEEEMEIE
jgi:hypothetical protein